MSLEILKRFHVKANLFDNLSKKRYTNVLSMWIWNKYVLTAFCHMFMPTAGKWPNKSNTPQFLDKVLPRNRQDPKHIVCAFYVYETVEDFVRILV